jgi:hypothetical protein
MTDDEISNLLRSETQIVVIEAPAGCGKTFQAASYAADAACSILTGKVLVLTHTHAACSVVAERTSEMNAKIEIKTLDSLINQIATAYRVPLGLPDDVAVWARNTVYGYEKLARKVSKLLEANPMISRHLSRLYQVIVCDEHQDSNEHQDAIVRQANIQGSKLRVFGDPMQIIPAGRGQDDVVNATEKRWDNLKELGEFGALETPHRWINSNKGLGDWILQVRQTLLAGTPINLSADLPAGVNIIFAENAALGYGSYRLNPENWQQVNAVVNKDQGLLCVAAGRPVISGLRSTFRQRTPIWEGHTRDHLEKYIDRVCLPGNDLQSMATAFICCLSELLVGFTSAKYGNRFCIEIQKVTANPRGKIPPHLKKMAEFVVNEPSHTGFSRAASYLKKLITDRVDGFRDIRIDHPRELDDLIKLGGFDDPVSGYAEIAHKRSRAHPKPPRKCLSTIHKSKGLEAEGVVVFACDGHHFPLRTSKRNLLYVALSRATENITIVLSKNNPSVFFT